MIFDFFRNEEKYQSKPIKTWVPCLQIQFDTLSCVFIELIGAFF